MSWEGVAVSETNRDCIAWLIAAGFSSEEIKRFIRRAEPQPGTVTHTQTVDTYDYYYNNNNNAEITTTRPGTGAQSPQQTVANETDEPQADCDVITTSPLLTRKQSEMYEIHGVSEEHQTGNRRSKQQRTAVRRNESQQKINANSAISYYRSPPEHLRLNENIACQPNNGSHNQTIFYDNSASPAIMRNSGNQNNVTQTRRYKLQFSGKIIQPLFTGESIKGEDGNYLMVVLIDTQSGQPVTSGLEASASLEIVVLKAGFGGGVCLTRGEFEANIVRKNGKPILTGNVVLNLRKGIASVASVGFPHTRIHTSSCNYQLGAIVTNAYSGTEISEGVTYPFVVKDRRIKTKKHYPPTSCSEVWRLDGIAKDGPFHQLLRDNNINTVKGFLRKHKSNPQQLRMVLERMSAIQWEALVAHARTCTADESQNFQTRESLSGTNIEMSPNIEKRDVSQLAVSFHSKELSVDDPTRGNELCITIQESCSGGVISIFPETVEVDYSNSVIPTKEKIEENIDSDRDNDILNKSNDHERHERPPHVPVGAVPFDTNGPNLESPDHRQKDGIEPFMACTNVHSTLTMGSDPSCSSFWDDLLAICDMDSSFHVDENIHQFDQLCP